MPDEISFRDRLQLARDELVGAYYGSVSPLRLARRTARVGNRERQTCCRRPDSNDNTPSGKSPQRIVVCINPRLCTNSVRLRYDTGITPKYRRRPHSQSYSHPFTESPAKPSQCLTLDSTTYVASISLPFTIFSIWGNHGGHARMISNNWQRRRQSYNTKSQKVRIVSSELC